jgi:hypothetical protein
MTAVANDSTKVVIREGNNFSFAQTQKKGKSETKTEYTFTIKDVAYDVYISGNGRCYIYRVSQKTGQVYKSYLPEEVARTICNELGVEYVELDK